MKEKEFYEIPTSETIVVGTKNSILFGSDTVTNSAYGVAEDADAYDGSIWE